MLSVIVAAMWVTLACAAVLLLGALIGRLPRPVVLATLAIGEAATLVAVAADVVWLVQGHPSPNLITHISYLLTTPLLIPAGFALTYKKFDRWGLVIVGVAALIATFMVIRQLQTLGIPFGYLNV